jgi:urease accessory protein
MKLWYGLPFLLLMMLPQPALAHGLIGNDLMAGLAHPVGGWDHLLAMVAVGIISTKIGGRAVWGVSLLFLLGMTAGYGLGLQKVIVPFTEWGILLSVVGLGLLLGWPQRPVLWVVTLLILLFGLSESRLCPRP